MRTCDYNFTWYFLKTLKLVQTLSKDPDKSLQIHVKEKVN